MYKLSTFILFPVMLISHTVSASGWMLFGINLGVFLYVVTTGIALYVGLRSRYRSLVTTMMVLTIVMRLFAEFSGSEPLRQMAFGSLAIVFAVAGAMMYGRNPFLLHKQLVVYLALCIPIMVMQIMGVSQFLMGWDMGYTHSVLDILSPGEIGTFKEVPLYPTLFVESSDNFEYSIGQGRPVGLMYGNNPLSVIVAIAVAVNLAITRTSRIKFSDIIVTMAIVLTMSKLAFSTMILLYLWFLVFGMRERRLLVLKLITILAIVMFLYYILFPGLFMSNLSEAMVMSSLMLRLMDVIYSLGIENSFGQLVWLSEVYKPYDAYMVLEEESYSVIGILLKSKLLIPLLFVVIYGSMRYAYRVCNMISRPTTVYVVTLIACILTQFGTVFYSVNSFQLVMGFALFPLFKKMSTPEGYSLVRAQAKD